MEALSEPEIQLKADFVQLSDGAQLSYELRSLKDANSELKTERCLMVIGAFSCKKHFEDPACFLVRQLKNVCNLQVLIYDHRGVGKSSLPGKPRKQSTQSLADDASQLIGAIWGKDAKVHLYGGSLGGMICQKLGVMLAKENRLLSLYLAVTSAKSTYSYLSFLGMGSLHRLLRYLYKNGNGERIVKEILMPEAFVKEDFDLEKFPCESDWQNFVQQNQKEWLENFDDWWAYGQLKHCAAQLAAVFSHKWSQQEADQLKGVPVSIQIATRDQVIPTKQQRQLAAMFTEPKIYELQQGHMAYNGRTKISLADHLKNVLNTSTN